VRKLVRGVLVLALLQPIQASAFFNRDCANLKKSISANQVKYEKAWDAYQSSLEKYLALPDSSQFTASKPVLARMVAVGKIMITMNKELLNFPKYRKVTNQSSFSSYNIKIQKIIMEYIWADLIFNPPFMELIDFRSYLK
jgi:hypothetical protein